jgi:hypothetical protein
MKEKECFICGSQVQTKSEIYQNKIYSPRGKALTISLCYGHSIELFKMGQATFMMKHKWIFTNFYGFDEDMPAINYFSYR